MPTITLTKVAGNPTSISSTSWIPISYDDRQNIQHAVANELKGPGIEITKIEVLCRARNSATATKRLQFGFKPALNSGRNTWSTFGGGNVLDSAFVAVDGSKNGSYIYRTFTRAYDANTNAAAFAKFAGHILESFNNDTDIFFSIIQPTSGRETQIYMSGYWSITITYDILGNVPTTNVAEAVVGSTAITTTITPVVTGSTTTLNYKYGTTVLSTVNLGTGTTHQYTPPTSVATTYFPNDLTGTLTVEAITYLSGVQYGTVSTTVTLTLPTSAAPTCSCTPSMLEQVISGVNAYVQNQSGVQFSVSGSAKLGASIVGYSLLFDGVVYDTFPATVSLLTHSGTLSYTLTVTDSRGLTGTASGSIYVYPWQKPAFLVGFACARATLSGEIDDDAESMLYTMSVAASPIEVGGVQYNTLSYQIKSRPIGAETWDLNDPVYAPAGDYALNPEELIMRGGNVAVYTAYQGYEFVVTVQDLFDSVQSEYTIPTNYRQFVIGADGKSVAFGGAITGTAGSPNAAFHNPAYFYGGISQLDYSLMKTYTGAKWIDGKPIYRKVLTFKTTVSQYTLSTGESAIDTLVSVRGMLKSASVIFPVPRAHTGAFSWQISVYLTDATSNPNLIIDKGSSHGDLTGFMVIEFTKPSRNLAYNNGFLLGSDGWTLHANSVVDTGKTLFGCSSVKVTESGNAADVYRGMLTLSTSRIPSVAGDVWMGSAYVFVQDYTTFAGSAVAVEVSYYNAAGTRLVSRAGVLFPTSAHNGKWTRIAVTDTTPAPANTASVGIFMYVRRNGTCWFACPQLEKDTVVTDWVP